MLGAGLLVGLLAPDDEPLLLFIEPLCEDVEPALSGEVVPLGFDIVFVPLLPVPLLLMSVPSVPGGGVIAEPLLLPGVGFDKLEPAEGADDELLP